MAENSDKREDPGLKQDDSGRPKRKPGLNIFQIGLIIMLAVIMLSIFLTKKQNEASYNEFREHLAAGHVEWVQLEDEEFVGVMTIPKDYKSESVPPDDTGENRGDDKPDITRPPYGGEIGK
ncbi:MAG: hypothetical protein MK554_01570 [Planctomycetes bacterium]|nr:hypothetical protein [Planctomycetota bacterium]